MASYPASIWSPAAMTLGATVLQQSLFDDPIAEIEAIETELGVGVNGSMGSLAERINMAMDQAGNARGLVFLHDASNGQRRRLRCGVSEIRCKDLSSHTRGLSGTVDFSPDLHVGCHAFCLLQNLEDDPTLTTVPALVGYIMDTGTVNSFDFFVATRSGTAPSATTSFLLHWVAIERYESTSTLDF